MKNKKVSTKENYDDIIRENEEVLKEAKKLLFF